MVYPPQLLDLLQQLEPVGWEGTAWRHMLGIRPADTENTRGARWNPPEVAAIYTSLHRDGAVAEGSHALASQPLSPRVRRIVYEVHVTLNSVLDLTDSDTLSLLGVGTDELASDDMRACRDVGGAAAWLEHDGILVPSARSEVTNLVIYPANRAVSAAFDVIREEELRPEAGGAV